MNSGPMSLPTGFRFAGRGLLVIVMLAASVVFSSAVAEAMLYRGKYVYVVPEVMAEKMTEVASKDSWKHFPDLTRYVDVDDDGRYDFVAIAFGVKGGYGAQIRYRLKFSGDQIEPRLGSWYWCVITDSSGVKIFEQFSP
jgi:hypothetical protein